MKSTFAFPLIESYVALWGPSQAEDGSLVQLMADASFSRTGGHGETRIVALHALGTLVGAERMDKHGDPPSFPSPEKKQKTS
jgi:hypothetical protein